VIGFCESCGKAKKADEAFCPGCGASSVPGVVMRARIDAASQAQSPTASATSGGIEPNVAGTLSYAFGVISGILFLLVEPHNRDRFVRFHAFQSILFNVALLVFWIVWGTGVALFEAVTGGFLLWLIIPIDLTLMLLIVGSWVFAMVRAYRGAKLKLPVIGHFAEWQANK
jgi:uncharacterized membrane protein